MQDVRVFASSDLTCPFYILVTPHVRSRFARTNVARLGCAEARGAPLEIIHGISSASIPLTFEIQSYYTRYANLIFVVYFIFKAKGKWPNFARLFQ